MMTAFFQGVAQLAPAAQLILALCPFTVIIIVAVSPTAKQNLCELFNSLARVFTRDRKPPHDPPDEPPQQGAA